MTSAKEQFVSKFKLALQVRKISQERFYQAPDIFGVSRRTLQRLMNGDPKISEATLERILKRLPSISKVSDEIARSDELELRQIIDCYRNLREEEATLVLRCIGSSKSEPCPETGDFFSTDRFCKSCSIKERWPKTEQDKYATTLPDWNRSLDVESLPALEIPDESNCPVDIFACLSEEMPELQSARRNKARDLGKISQFLPFDNDFLRSCGWRCGSPRVYSSRRIEVKTGLSDVCVLDMGWYQWSRTLKDPRSWAIVNAAIEADPIRNHLGVWTAGNAGLSLAMVAHAANLHLPPEKRLQVYALYNLDEEERGLGSAKRLLRHWQCKTEPVPNPHKRVLSPAEIKEKVRDIADSSFQEENYWDVSDGWETVGLVVYRLIFAQVIHQLKPSVVVVPAGTGNLLLGAVMAVRDCQRQRETEIVAAVPEYNSVFDQIDEAKAKHESFSAEQSGTKGTQGACLPKLTGAYSPLLPCLDIAQELFTVRRVTQAMHTEMALKLMGDSKGLAVIAEPSAVGAFAVLPDLVPEHRTDKILVVNTGYGLLRDDEREFWSRVSI